MHTVYHVHTTWAPCTVERDVRCVPLVRGSIRAAARVRRVRLRKSNYVHVIQDDTTSFTFMNMILTTQQLNTELTYRLAENPDDWHRQSER